MNVPYSMCNARTIADTPTSTPCVVSPSTLTHTAEEDYTALWNNLRESITLMKAGLDRPVGQGAFGHLMNGYDAGYYGYMYSLVFSADMWATVFERNPLDPALGRLPFMFLFPLRLLSFFSRFVICFLSFDASLRLTLVSSILNF